MACFSLQMETEASVLSAILENIGIEGDIEKGKRSHFSVRIYLAGKEVAKSDPRHRSSGLHWEWKAENKIWFEPSSIMKVVISRGARFGTNIGLLNNLVGQYEGKVVDLLKDSGSFELKDKKGNPIPAKMKITLSRISGPVDKNEVVEPTVSTLGQVLRSTKALISRPRPSKWIVDALNTLQLFD
ncbi:hypothetical protein GALMADRAFT_774955 [Galerina marginata CBS 339.88]|uniref:C2 domain-containing protein n=1 Tax=Galerina marginata (strain CBS 339.88) TaxID=685588 RepID=A0A067SMH5_GALM3|nr:hypothetical protein GALMADRAFT_774955 [Galerina marginata CBS 339.88]